jgi:general stress protein CsbA
VAALLAAIPFVELLGVLNQKMIVGAGAQKWVKEMEEDAARQIRFMLARHTPEELLKNLVFIALFAGVGEELFFRGILQRLFIRITRSPWLGIVITAVLFSAIHMQFLGFFPRVFLGVLLGVIYWYSGSLWPAILAHFLYDGLIIVVLYLNPQMMENPNAPLVKASQLIPMGLVSAAATGFLVWLMVKRSSSRFDQVYKDDFPPTDQLSF